MAADPPFPSDEDGIFLRSAFLLLLAAACGCGGTANEARRTSAIEVLDDAGNAVRLDEPARRILSLIPARTDALLELGAADRLIARTQYDDDPRIAHLPSVGNALTPSVEWVMAQRPDLVIAWPDAQARTVVGRLVELGVPVYASNVETLADVERAVAHLGVLTGLQARADSVLRWMAGEHGRVRASVAGRPPPDVLYVIGLEPLMAAGTGTFVDELIEIAGGRNVFGDAGVAWPQVSLEEVVRRDPDVLVIASAGVDSAEVVGRLRERAGWRGVTAVRTGRVYIVDPYLFNRPGPSLGRAATIIARLLHPDAGAENVR